MRYLKIILVLIISLVQISHAQRVPPDSLKAVFLNQKAIDSVRYESGVNYVLSQMGRATDTSRAYGHQLLDFALDKENKTWEASAYRLIGISYAVQGEFTEANAFFFKSHDILIKLDDKKGLATTLNNIGTAFYEMGSYTQAQDYLLQSLKLAEELNDDNAASRALNNLGNVHNDLRNNEKALDYYKRSLALKEKLGFKNRLPAAYNNIGLIYSNINDRDLAIENLERSAAIAEELGDIRSMTRAYNNLGIQYSKREDYAKALEYFNESVTKKAAINDTDGLASAYLYRGQNYLNMKDYRKAITDCMKSLEMTEVSGALNLQKEACGCISNAEEAIGRFQSALNYHQRYLSLKDSLFNKQKTQEITRAEMNYEFEKKQLADSISFHKRQTEQKVAYEQDINKQHRKFYITLIISLLVIAFMLFLYWRYNQNLKLKKLENELLNSEIEYKKKDLTNFAVNISNNQDWAESLAERLEVLKASTGRKRVKELEELEAEIKNKIWVNKDSDQFYKKIDTLSSSFYDKLTSQFEGLSKNDIRLCSLIKLDLNTKQIATLQNINPSSVKMSRNRLRKKLNLSPEDDLNAFLKMF